MVAAFIEIKVQQSQKSIITPKVFGQSPLALLLKLLLLFKNLPKVSIEKEVRGIYNPASLRAS
ncbi:MAG: hypothetical protein K2Q18_01920 [Bdellovibrionales bacterium]|nr:hypothetical protein [Bdellovibrionales bacterium]